MIGGGPEPVVVQLEVDGPTKPAPHYGKQVLMALHGNPSWTIGQPTYLIAVGPDMRSGRARCRSRTRSSSRKG